MVAGGQGPGGWVGRLGLADTVTFRMGKQQGPTVERGELYSISCDKP